MEENVGGTDQLLRILVGAVLGLVSLAQLAELQQLSPLPMWLSPVLGVLALILLGTGLSKRCMINDLLGRDTSE